jgi:hypothetical protein
LDEDRYDTLLETIAERGESLDKFGNKKKKAKSSSKGDRTRNRVAERRASRKAAAADADDDAGDDNEPDAEPAPEEAAPKSRRTRTAKAKGEGDQKGRMSELRALSAEKAEGRKAK